MTWLLLSTVHPKAGYYNAINEHALKAVLEPNTALTSIYDRPTNQSLAAIHQGKYLAAVCPGGPTLNPQVTSVWSWAAQLHNIGVNTFVVGATGVTPAMTERPGWAEGALSLCAADYSTIATIRQSLNASVQLVGSLGLLVGFLHERDEEDDDDHLIVSFTQHGLPFQTEWLQTLVQHQGRPVRILVHSEKEWAFAGQVASVAPSAQIIDVSSITTLEQWAALLQGGICVTPNDAEAIAAASIGTPTVAISPAAPLDLDLDKSVYAQTGMPVAILDDGVSVLTPQQVCDAATTIDVTKHVASLQALLEWMQGAHLPIRRAILDAITQPQP